MLVASIAVYRNLRLAMRISDSDEQGAIAVHPLFNTSHSAQVVQVESSSRAVRQTPRTLLVIATVPRSQRHIVALWTELECLASSVDDIVLVAPHEQKELVDQVVKQAKEVLHRNIQTMYFENDFYDVGLWCNALATMGYPNNASTVQRLHHNNHTMTPFS